MAKPSFPLLILPFMHVILEPAPAPLFLFFCPLLFHPPPSFSVYRSSLFGGTDAVHARCDTSLRCVDKSLWNSLTDAAVKALKLQPECISSLNIQRLGLVLVSSLDTHNTRYLQENDRDKGVTDWSQPRRGLTGRPHVLALLPSTAAPQKVSIGLLHLCVIASLVKSGQNWGKDRMM